MDRCFLLRGWLALQPFDLDATAEGVNLAVQLRRPLPEGLWPAIAPPEVVLEIWLGPPGDLGRLCGRGTSGSKAALFKLANVNPSYPLYARSYVQGFATIAPHEATNTSAASR